MPNSIRWFVVVLWGCCSIAASEDSLVSLRGKIVDADTELPVAARIYVKSADGQWFFPTSDDPAG